MSIFYVAVPKNPNYSNYFALFKRGNHTLITDGISATQGTIVAVKADNGEIIYSRYRNDFRGAKDGSVWIDGGRDYTRTSSFKDTIGLRIVDGEIVIESPKKTPSIK